MKKEFARLAVLQIILIVYSILGSALLLKLYRPYHPPHGFAIYVRDWGFLLLFVSAAWCIGAVVAYQKSSSNTVLGISLGASGIGLVLFYTTVALAATVSAIATTVPDQPILMKVESTSTPKPSISNRQLPPDP